MTADPIPSLHVQTGTGVDPAAIDYALGQLRTVCAGHRVQVVRARLVRGSAPELPDAVLADAKVMVRRHAIRVGGSGRCPRAAIDQLCDRLATRLQQASAPR